ncbi:MAG: chromosome segregation protein SMC [Planctomycetes bacterium]|nr:chromosome segregation protein SMC [Planctomycetota bacterium]
MFLKRITLCGFKSFGDRVEFDFGPGVTCVVGPNGCGKSNVLDAFKWVLGEQSARSLRGRQMTDMIFNGSSTRRASSVAQVDLVFGNADRLLPFDQDEVQVTRKLYRSGESEYLLNQQPVRLKDIRELFMDTGVGVDAYSVIEQGRVDSLLQSSPVERRVIFEEAAGISKYKARKREAQRKLDRTQQNLLRVDDIIEELERRLRSVKLQAGKARNYKQYEARLNELRSTYALAEYHRLTQQHDALNRDAQVFSDRSTALRTTIDRHEAEESGVTVKLDRLADEIASADNQLVQANSDLAGQEERIDGAARRIEEQNLLEERSQERLSADRRRLEETHARVSEVEQTAVALERQQKEYHASIDRLVEEDRSLARELALSQAVLEDEKSGIIDLLRKSAQVHNDVVRLSTQRESLVGQKGRLCTRDAQIANELEEQLEQKSALDARSREIETLIAEQIEALEVKTTEARRVDGVRQRLVDELASMKERRSALLSRRDLLEDLQRNREGVGAGVRQLLDSTTKPNQGDTHVPDSSTVIAGLVADIVDTDIAHAAIIEAALGERDQHLVVTDSRAFLAMIDDFDQLSGRLTALCLDRLSPTVNERDFSDQPGFVARVMDLARVPDAFERLARHLFAKTVVVENLDAALAMASLDVSGHRFVTTSGEIVEPDGRITLGPATAGTGLISRRSELREIEAELTGFETTVAKLVDQLNRTEAEVTYLEEVQQELRSAIYESKTSRAEANAGSQRIAEAIERLTGEKPLIAGEIALIEQQIEEVLVKAGQGASTLEALELENKQREAKVAERQERMDNVVERRQRGADQLTEAKVVVGQLREKRAAAAETRSTLQRSLGDIEAVISTAEHDIAQCRAKIEESERTIETGQERAVALKTTIEQLEARAAQLRNEREKLRLDLQSFTQGVKTSRDELEQIETQLHECQMSLTQANVRRDELVARLAEELSINLVEQYEQRQCDDQDWEQDWEQVETEIGELRQKMSRLGNVNLDAIDELAEIEERHGFLTGQRDDLTESHRQLEQLIARLDQESRERFEKSFVQIRDNFRSLFRKLFGGGRADIILEDPDNVLDCGIEIVAQPPGKDLQIISLMSGGEKSLTAIALLMSIFKCRPAPFAILDEVDAALDEANNDRFNRIIQEFVAESQFIIITHSKRTMSIGDRLYGITMQEPGVSTRVSVQLADTHVA